MWNIIANKARQSVAARLGYAWAGNVRYQYIDGVTVEVSGVTRLQRQQCRLADALGRPLN